MCNYAYYSILLLTAYCGVLQLTITYYSILQHTIILQNSKIGHMSNVYTFAKANGSAVNIILCE